jgi:hypothetical protein
MGKFSSHKALAVIWTAFALNFASLAGYHYNATKSIVPDFVIPERPYAPQVTVHIAGAGIDQPLRDFTKAINKYTHDQNVSSQQQNWISFYGYLVAMLTALFSAGIELLPRDKKEPRKGSEGDGDKPRKQLSLVTGGKECDGQSSNPESQAKNEGPDAQRQAENEIAH